MVFSPDALAAAGHAYAAAGTTLLRMPGHRGPVPPSVRADPALPRLVTAGAWLGWHGLADLRDLHTRVDDLAAAAVAEALANDGWAKTYGDWEPFESPTPVEVLRAAVDAVHAVGGRVAAHCQTAVGVHNAVVAGVDSIEHAWYLTADLVDLLAARGGAITPTWTGFAPHIDAVHTKPEGPRKDWFLGGTASLAPGVRMAHEAGVRVLAGTDSLSFGDVVTEVEWLMEIGLPPVAAIGAASWDARSYLGFPGLVEGAPADVVAYPEDPRTTPGVLRHPSRVILRGAVIG
jgi:imidazolonepropionase-like amidohydrolase